MKTKRFLLWSLLVLSLVSIMTPADALRNPSAVYCASLGYTYVTKETPEGAVGSCKISGSVECDSWDFLGGRCGTDYNYCARQGLGQRIGKGDECGVDNAKAECLVCILSDGSVREVTHLMNLKVDDGVCGDGACVMGEDHVNCPKDCPAGTAPAGPKTIRYKYWDLSNETATSTSIPVQEKNAQPSTTVPEKSSGFSSSNLYLIVILFVLLLVLFIGLRRQSSRKSR